MAPRLGDAKDNYGDKFISELSKPKPIEVEGGKRLILKHISK